MKAGDVTITVGRGTARRPVTLRIASKAIGSRLVELTSSQAKELATVLAHWSREADERNTEVGS